MQVFWNQPPPFPERRKKIDLSFRLFIFVLLCFASQSWETRTRKRRREGRFVLTNCESFLYLPFSISPVCMHAVKIIIIKRKSFQKCF